MEARSNSAHLNQRSQHTSFTRIEHPSIPRGRDRYFPYVPHTLDLAKGITKNFDSLVESNIFDIEASFSYLNYIKLLFDSSLRS